jgi:hypothetical protein
MRRRPLDPRLHPHLEAGPDAEATEVHALAWGDAAHSAALLGVLGPSRGLRVVVGADVVYHEPLIEPLLASLVALTEGPAPPPVLLTYVQRFKRAKLFFKKARRSFDVEALSLGELERALAGPGAPPPPFAGLVVDYDALTFTLPHLQPAPTAAEGAAAVRVGADSSDYRSYLRAVILAAAAAAGPGEARRGAGGKATGGAGRDTAPAAPAVWHAVDSDTDPEEDQAATFLGAFADAAEEAEADARPQAEVETETEAKAEVAAMLSASGCVQWPSEAVLLARAQAAAAALGLRLADPLKAYIYVLRRKSRRSMQKDARAGDAGSDGSDTDA